MGPQLPGFALIAGADSAIGQATVLAYAEGGVSGAFIIAQTLAVAESIAEKSRAVASHPQYRAVAYEVATPSDEKAVEDAVKSAAKEFGRLDFVANLTTDLGPVKAQKLGDYDTATFFGTIDGNLRALFNYMRAELQVIQAQEPLELLAGRGTPVRGSIVNLCSGSGATGLGGHAAFSAAQHAVTGLIKTVGIDYAKDGIRVNGVATTIVQQQTESKAEPKFFQTVGSLDPEPESPEDVADVFAFLSSPQASFVTGAIWAVSTGGTML